jgi:predicted RNA-binding Zn-ribbon protein involved in translation (DUF1610 family)
MRLVARPNKRSDAMYAVLVKKGQTEATCPICGETLIGFKENDVYVGGKYVGKIPAFVSAIMTKNGLKVFRCEHLSGDKCEWYRCQNGDWIAFIRDGDNEPKPVIG